MSPKNSARAVQVCAYSTVMICAQAVIWFLLPALGVHVSPIVTAALISVLAGGGTLALHELGIVIPGAPADFGLQQVLAGLVALLEQQGWQPPAQPPPPSPPPPSPPSPPPSPPSPLVP